MIQKVKDRYEKWLSGPYDSAMKEEIRRLLKEEPDQLIDAFYCDLSFGTGGMRAIMGVGTNRMNIYTVRQATQGLANYLLKESKPHRVFIGYDVRINSRLFAEETARTLAGNGIMAYLTNDVCPTPLASFGCRYFRCSAAVMITASHNPPQYNGYKVFWSDGAQVVPPHDNGIIAEVRQIHHPDQARLAPLTDPLIHWVNREIDEAYLKELDKLRTYSFASPPTLQIVYTNLHGTGIRLIPGALDRRGFSNILHVTEQKSLDGRFPYAPLPNPEEEKALEIGTRQLMDQKADILLATDPDADRLGAVVRNQDSAVRLNGHEIACICLFHLATMKSIKNEISPNAAFIKTIVTTELARKIAEDFGIRCFDVLTGFKYIAELIRKWKEEAGSFLFGAEESHGYLIGTFVRDKDAIGAACLLCEAAQRAKDQNRNLIDLLYDLFLKYGAHRQSLTTISLAGSVHGLEKMQSIMAFLRKNPPLHIANRPIVRLDDYFERQSFNRKTGQYSPLLLPISDTLGYYFEDGSKLIIRPSGTEPKIKIYAEVFNPPTPNIKKSIAECDQRLQELTDDFNKRIKMSKPAQDT